MRTTVSRSDEHVLRAFCETCCVAAWVAGLRGWWARLGVGAANIDNLVARPAIDFDAHPHRDSVHARARAPQPDSVATADLGCATVPAPMLTAGMTTAPDARNGLDERERRLLSNLGAVVTEKLQMRIDMNFQNLQQRLTYISCTAHDIR